MQTPNMNEPAKTRQFGLPRFASLLGGSQMEELYKLKNEIEELREQVRSLQKALAAAAGEEERL